jgi:hypothetical protein
MCLLQIREQGISEAVLGQFLQLQKIRQNRGKEEEGRREIWYVKKWKKFVK